MMVKYKTQKYDDREFMWWECGAYGSIRYTGIIRPLKPGTDEDDPNRDIIPLGPTNTLETLNTLATEFEWPIEHKLVKIFERPIDWSDILELICNCGYTVSGTISGLEHDDRSPELIEIINDFINHIIEES